MLPNHKTIKLDVTPMHLHGLASQGKIAEFKQCLEQGADIEAILRSTNTTPLQSAVAHNQLDMVKFLLERKADMYCRKSLQRRSALYFVDRDSVNGMSVGTHLLEHKADVNYVDDFQESPLMQAVSSTSTEWLELLLEHKADPTLVSKGGFTAINIALAFKAEKSLHIIEKAIKF